MAVPNKRILIVDDEPSIANTLEIIFQQFGYDATVVYSGEAALAFVRSHQPSLVVTDVVMPGMNGIALAKAIRMSCPECPVLLFSGSADTKALLAASHRDGNTFEVLAKPVPPLQMLLKVASLLGQKTTPLYS
jgi:CheY-like chemotaxis protein